MRLLVTHIGKDAELLPSEFQLRSAYPFDNQATIEPWVAVVIGGCDGTRTGRELYAQMRDQEVISSDLPELKFSGVLRQLISAGFLELEEFPLPRVAS